MKCPKCGYHRQSRDNAFVPATECPACGVVYSKHENGTPAEPVRGAAISPPGLKPSPVDPDSLKKARDRVEKRLRKRLKANVQDERHAQTLKLARRFTEAEMRKRLEQRKEKQHQDADANDAEVPKPAAEEAQVAEAETTPAEPLKEVETTMAASDQTDNADVTPATAAVKDPSDDADTDADKEEITATAAPETETETATEALAETTESDSDVSVETVILTTTPPEPSDDELTPSFDSTSLDTKPAAEDAPDEDAALQETEQTPVAPEAIEAASTPAFSGLGWRANGFVSMLSAVAWLLLVAGIIGAVLSWTTISDVEAGMRIPVPDSLSSLPLGLLLGFAYLATGALGFAFFWVSSIISGQLKDIRRLLMLQPSIIAAVGQADDFADGIEDEEPLEA